MEKVLIACPIHQSKQYCIDEWMKYVCEYITHPNYQVYLVDNSDDKNWHLHLQEKYKHYKHLTIVHYRPAGKNEFTPAEIIAACQNKILTFARKIGAVKWMSIECDNFSEQDVIERLDAHNLPVVGAYYHTYLGYDRTPLMQVIDCEDSYDIGLPQKPRLITYKEALAKINGELQPIHGIGMGCTLYDMEIFNTPDQDGKLLALRSDKTGRGLSDSYLYADLQALGIPVYLDSTIRCVHLNDSWEHKNLGRDMQEHVNKKQA